MNFRPMMPCCICGLPIEASQEKVAIPRFEANQKALLYNISNGTAHRLCFESHPARTKVEERIRLALEFRQRTHTCVVCGEPIKPRDLVTPGFITDEHESPLFEFNYTTAHKEHLEQWTRYPELKRLIEELQCSPNWQSWAPLLPNTEYNRDPTRT